jgi:uncharacterized delta-60 repeat protein
MNNIIERDLISATCNGDKIALFYKDNRPFGSNGVVTFSDNFNITTDYGKGKGVIDSNNRLILSATIFDTVEDNTNFSTIRVLNDGNLDLTFGTNGYAITDINGALNDDYATTNVLDSQERIIVGGFTNAPNSIYTIVRYTQNGILDTTFGTNGIAVLNDLSQASFLNSLAYLTVDNEDKIIIQGNKDNKIFVARLYNDGTLDTSFGSGLGYIILNDFAVSQSAGIQIDSSNRIILAGTINRVDTNDDFASIRLTSSGIIDAAYGVNGYALCDISGNMVNDSAYNLILDNSDNSYVCGVTNIDDFDNIVIVKYDVSGNVDTNFANNGVLTIQVNNVDLGSYAINIDTQERLIVGGYLINYETSDDFVVTRIDLSGNIDTSFGPDISGFVIIDISNNSFDEFPISILTDSQDRIVLFGIDYNVINDKFEQSIVRLRESGLFDSSYRFYTYYSIDNGTTWNKIQKINKFISDNEKTTIIIDIPFDYLGNNNYNIVLKTNKNELSNTLSIVTNYRTQSQTTNIRGMIFESILPIAYDVSVFVRRN